MLWSIVKSILGIGFILFSGVGILFYIIFKDSDFTVGDFFEPARPIEKSLKPTRALEPIKDLVPDKFLSIWDGSTGKPTTNPSHFPFPYKKGDFYHVGIDGKYKPFGVEYTGEVSTELSPFLSKAGDLYIYDGNKWRLCVYYYPERCYNSILCEVIGDK